MHLTQSLKYTKKKLERTTGKNRSTVTAKYFNNSFPIMARTGDGKGMGDPNHIIDHLELVFLELQPTAAECTFFKSTRDPY